MIVKNNYDVIVVGAGPGGSFAARGASENGADVLLIEKRSEIGAPKRCGEGLSTGGLERLGLKPDKKWITNEIRGARIFAPNGKSIDIEYGETRGYVIERKVFDKYLAMEAARAGACVRARHEAVDIIKENGFVKGLKIMHDDEVFEVNSKVVIAADGVESKIARLAGINSTNKLMDIDSGYQYEMVLELEKPDFLDLYFGNKIAPRGYCWIFPKGKDVANVGIGIGGASMETAKKYLDDFVEKHEFLKNGSIVEVNTGGIPVGNPLKELVSDGLMIVGDAAHQVNAIHGGGIQEASIAGRIAGMVAAQCVKKNDFSKKALAQYEREWRALRASDLEKIVKLRQVVEKLSDENLNMLADELKPDDIIELTRGKKFGVLAKILMKKPSLIKLARFLV